MGYGSTSGWSDETGSGTLQAAGAALAALALVIALLAGVKTLGPAVHDAFVCAASVLDHGTGGCGAQTTTSGTDRVSEPAPPARVNSTRARQSGTTASHATPGSPSTATKTQKQTTAVDAADTPAASTAPAVAAQSVAAPASDASVADASSPLPPAPIPAFTPTTPRPPEPPLPPGVGYPTDDNQYNQEHCVEAGRNFSQLCSDDLAARDRLAEQTDCPPATADDILCNGVDSYFYALEQARAEIARWEAEQQQKVYQQILAQCQARQANDAADRCSTTMIGEDGAATLCQLTALADPLESSHQPQDYRCGTAQQWQEWDRVDGCEKSWLTETTFEYVQRPIGQCDQIDTRSMLQKVIDGDATGAEGVLGTILTIVFPPLGLAQSAVGLDQAIQSGDTDAILNGVAGVVLEVIPLPGRAGTTVSKLGLSIAQVQALQTLTPGTVTVVKLLDGRVVAAKATPDGIQIIGDAASLKQLVDQGAATAVDLVKRGVPLTDLDKAGIILSTPDLLRLAGELPPGPQRTAARARFLQTCPIGAADGKLPGLAAPLAACYSPKYLRTWLASDDAIEQLGGVVTYQSDAAGRNAGISATITPAMITAGSPTGVPPALVARLQLIYGDDIVDANGVFRIGSAPAVNPAGWPATNRGNLYNRGHLFANMFGGSGGYANNLITMHAIPNQRYMRPVEDWVTGLGRNGQTVQYNVQVSYASPTDSVPAAVRIIASDGQGNTIDVTIANTSQGGYTWNQPQPAGFNGPY